MSTEPLMTWDDLAARWKPDGETPEKQRRWLRDKARRWKLRAMKGTRGETARFRPLDVINAEARAAGKPV